jgi:hypothetical protein
VTDDVIFIPMLVVADVCGVAASAIAANRNRSAAGFFFAGFFLGPIGVHAALVIVDAPPFPPAGHFRADCPRCEATEIVVKGSPSYECWQCKTIVNLESPGAPAFGKAVAAT